MIRTTMATLAIGTAVLAASSANAALVTNYGAGLATPSAGFTIVNNFNGPNALASLTGSKFNVMPATQPGIGTAPGNTNPAGTPFLAVFSGGAATYAFAQLAGAFQFDWGSTDVFNKLTVNYTRNGVDYSSDFIPGLGAVPSNNSSGRFTVAGNAGEVFRSITFTNTSSARNAFEVDNIAIAAVPEPATWAMLLVGFGMIGAASRYRRRNTTAAIA